MTPEEMNAKGEEYFYKGDYKQSFEWTYESANLGCLQAFYNLAYLYQNMDYNYTQAAYWYQKAVDSGHAAAHNNLGEMYRKGQGVSQDYWKAYNLFTKAAHVNACCQYNLGCMYYRGEGVVKDFGKAIEWWRKAVRNDYKPAQDALFEYFKINFDGICNEAKPEMTCEQVFTLWYGEDVLSDELTKAFIAHAEKTKKCRCDKCKSENVWSCSAHKLKPTYMKVLAFITGDYGSGLGTSLAGADLIGLCEDCGYFSDIR